MGRVECTVGWRRGAGELETLEDIIVTSNLMQNRYFARAVHLAGNKDGGVSQKKRCACVFVLDARVRAT